MSEWKGSHPTGQSISNIHWDDSGDIPPLEEEQAQDQAAYAYISQDDDENEDDGDDWAVHSRWEMIRQWGHQFSPVLAPLVFGGITFLLTILLSFLLKKPPTMGSLVPLAIIFVAIAIAQGTALYYSGAQNALWSLSMIFGFILFLLVGCFVLFGPLISFILIVLFVIFGGLVARLYIHVVPEGFVAIVESLGKYSRTLPSGLHLLLPWERLKYLLDIRTIQWVCPVQTVRISPDEDLYLAASILYQLMPEDAHLAVLYVNDWEASLQDLVCVTLQSLAKELTPQDFLAWPKGLYSRQESGFDAAEDAIDVGATHWEWMNDVFLQRVQDTVALWGVQINAVFIRDITLSPHSPTRPGANTGTATATNVNTNASTGTMSQPTPNVGGTQVPPPAPSSLGSPASSASPPVPTTPPKYGSLVKAYEAVRSKSIRDAETIRRLAQRFEAIAKDPEASKHVNFDATRAAETLYQRAQVLEAREQAGAGRGGNSFPPSSPTEWSSRPPADENIQLGG